MCGIVAIVHEPAVVVDLNGAGVHRQRIGRPEHDVGHLPGLERPDDRVETQGPRRVCREPARFASAEVSFDHDWWRIRGTFIWASGDSNPDDDKAEGFDAIFDNPNIAGGPFSFWNREGIRLTQTSVGLVARSSILPSLRSSKVEGQANFVNPGLFEYNAGFEADLTPKLRMTADANLLRFQYTDVLSRVLFQSNIDRSIGTDYSVGFQYRPALNDNVVVTGGASLFMPSAGFKKLLTTDKLFAPF